MSFFSEVVESESSAWFLTVPSDESEPLLPCCDFCDCCSCDCSLSPELPAYSSFMGVALGSPHADSSAKPAAVNATTFTASCLLGMFFLSSCLLISSAHIVFRISFSTPNRPGNRQSVLGTAGFGGFGRIDEVDGGVAALRTLGG